MTLLALASRFIRSKKIPLLASWGATFSQALIDKSGNVVVETTAGVMKDGTGATLSLTPAKVVTSTPITSGTVAVDSSKADQIINLTPAGTLSALTFTFPSDGNSVIGQKLTLQSNQIVTTLTVSSAGLTLNGDAVTSLAVNSPVSWVKTAASTWNRTASPATQTLTNLLAAAGSGQAIRSAFQKVTTSSPVTTNSISCNASGLDDIQYLTPAGTIAALTYVFPSDANSQLGQVIEITSTQIVSTLTLTTSGLTIVGTAQTALAVNTPARFRKVKASTWLVLA